MDLFKTPGRGSKNGKKSLNPYKTNLSGLGKQTPETDIDAKRFGKGKKKGKKFKRRKRRSL